ncbi:MAG TPA: hypothetical protein VNV86_21730 [Candidatus Acidoferrum sp.]|nr:hypothetical protein [Candidatus Acidoferrum sp.]
MPDDFRAAFLERAAEPGVVFGSKAVGELPLMLAISVREVIRDAIDTSRSANRLFARDSNRTLSFDLTRVLVEIGLICAEDDFSRTMLYAARAGGDANRHPDLDITFQVDHRRILSPTLNLGGGDRQGLRAARDRYREVFPFTGGIVLSA